MKIKNTLIILIAVIGISAQGYSITRQQAYAKRAMGMFNKYNQNMMALSKRKSNNNIENSHSNNSDIKRQAQNVIKQANTKYHRASRIESAYGRRSRLVRYYNNGNRLLRLAKNYYSRNTRVYYQKAINHARQAIRYYNKFLNANRR